MADELENETTASAELGTETKAGWLDDETLSDQKFLLLETGAAPLELLL